jgi:hypothetical protein
VIADRYSVTIIQGDGVPYDALETPDLSQALRERNVRREQHANKGHSYYCGVMDLNDPERGWLEWPEDD